MDSHPYRVEVLFDTMSTHTAHHESLEEAKKELEYWLEQDDVMEAHLT
jgi:hypothetical protein